MCFIIEPSAVAYSLTIYTTRHPIVPPLVTMCAKRLQNKRQLAYQLWRTLKVHFFYQDVLQNTVCHRESFVPKVKEVQMTSGSATCFEVQVKRNEGPGMFRNSKA